MVPDLTRDSVEGERNTILSLRVLDQLNTNKYGSSVSERLEILGLPGHRRTQFRHSPRVCHAASFVDGTSGTEAKNRLTRSTNFPTILFRHAPTSRASSAQGI
jgi:hypothetical protein